MCHSRCTKHPPPAPTRSCSQQAQQGAEARLHQATAACTHWAAPPGTKAEPLVSHSACTLVSRAWNKRKMGTAVHIYGTVQLAPCSCSNHSNQVSFEYSAVRVRMQSAATTACLHRAPRPVTVNQNKACLMLTQQNQQGSGAQHRSAHTRMPQPEPTPSGQAAPKVPQVPAPTPSNLPGPSKAIYMEATLT